MAIVSASTPNSYGRIGRTAWELQIPASSPLTLRLRVELPVGAPANLSLPALILPVGVEPPQE